MDLLFTKYASPFLLLDGFILIGKFEEFIYEFLKLDNDNKLWDFYLHKVYGRSFIDFKNSLETTQSSNETSKEEIETTVKSSKNILNNFIPK